MIRRDRRKAERVESDSDDELGSDLSGDELQTREPIDGEEDADNEVIGAENDALIEHVKPENFRGVQYKILDIKFMGSLEEMEAGTVDTIWKLSDHMPVHFKQNMAKKNRHLATEADLAGDTNMMIPLELEILRDMNTTPIGLGLRNKDMLSNTITKNGAYLWTTDPDSVSTPVNQLVLQPTNPVSKKLYVDGMLYSQAALDSDIVTVEKSGKNEAYGTIAVKSMGYNVLVEGIHKGLWANEKLDVEAIEDAPSTRQRRVEVPYKVAADIKEELAKPIRELKERCTSVDDISFELCRTDGETAFNSVANLHQALCGSELDADHKITSAKLQQRGIYSVKVKLAYILVDPNQD
jgi:hypothetical protein